MIRAPHRLKGGADQLGATGPGLRGPYGVWPADHDQGDEDQEHELAVDHARETTTR
ncbi:hypothetical protein [Streptomyces sp. NPDC088915]|uniref:hypothetical protein n=1 Tax=Streptomyces sp. NPDC088915 TaxID=3365912 RepID=UPI0037F5DB93